MGVTSVNAADAMLYISSERDVRHFSIQVLGDSKKLKGLIGKIAKLHRVRDQVIPQAISNKEVFQLFGVVTIKHRSIYLVRCGFFQKREYFNRRIARILCVRI